MPVTDKQSSSAARLNFRLPSEIKDRIETAALVSGVTVTDFAVAALADRADQVLEKHERRVLSDRDREVFLRLLENPPEPNDRLTAAVRKYKKRSRPNE